MIFVDGKQESIEGALKVLDAFAAISGLEVSREKSTLFSSGIQPSVLREIRLVHNLNTGKLPVRYLGLPLLTKKLGRSDYRPLVDRIRDKLSSWTGRCLSYAGRLQLLKAVITGITQFWISAFILPGRCIKEIESLCSAFLWSGPQLNSNKAKIAWTDVCKPEEGGLGIRNLLESNKVSTYRLIWRLLSSTSIWGTWVKTYLLRNASFWSVDSRTTLGSWQWKKLLRLRPHAQKFHRIEVGNGESTFFWYDCWNNLGQLLELTGNRGAIELGIPLNATVQEASAIIRNRRLRSNSLRRIYQTIMPILSSLQSSTIDQHTWLDKENRYLNRFSSSNTWQVIRHKHPRQRWEKAIWFSFSTPKHGFITWIAALHRLPTADKIARWSPRTSTSCVFCSVGVESRNHLFFLCSFTGYIWKSIYGTLHTDTVPHRWDSILKLLMEGSTTKTRTFLLRYAFQATLYHVWRERNSIKHGSSPSTQTRLIRQIDKEIRNRISSIPNQQTEIYIKGLHEWFHSRV